MRIELVEALKTGHSDIDHDHAEIIDAANAISNAVDSYSTPATLQKLVEQFLVLCEDHFHNEEQVLEKAHYPDLKEHIRYHRLMSSKARSVQALYTQTNSHAKQLKHIEDMISFLIDDIVRSDMSFVSHLQDKGMAHA